MFDDHEASDEDIETEELPPNIQGVNITILQLHTNITLSYLDFIDIVPDPLFNINAANTDNTEPDDVFVYQPDDTDWKTSRDSMSRGEISSIDFVYLYIIYAILFY